MEEWNVISAFPIQDANYDLTAIFSDQIFLCVSVCIGF